METKRDITKSVTIGVVTVLSVLGIGIGAGFASGFVTPESVFGAFAGDSPCCLVHWDGGGGGSWGGWGGVGGSWDGGGGGGGYTPEPICTISASPSSSPANGQVTLSWTTSFATSASINQGIGSVSVGSGSLLATVGTHTTTYVMTVTKGSKTDTCETTVTVTTPPPVCTLVVDPTVITRSDAIQIANLSWTTANATSFVINQGIGSVSPVPGGSKEVSPDETTTYTGTATGPGGTVTCNATLTVKHTPPPPPPKERPTCVFSATPASIQAGDDSTLSWTTTNATSVVISNGIGSVTPVASGSTSVSPAETTVYSLTATGPGGQVACATKVTVTPPPPAPGCIRVLKETFDTKGNPLTPVAQFTFKLDGSQIAYNDADGNAIFNNVTPGTHTVTEIVPETWTQLSVTPTNGTVVVSPGPTCAAVVFKNKQVITTPNAPTCTLSATDRSTYDAVGFDLAWTTTNATSFVINNGVGSVTPVPNGSTVVNPPHTTTYTGTATGPGGTVECTATVKVRPKGECKLEITKSVDREQATEGEEVDYTVSFKNTGTADCTGGGVKVVDSLDARLLYVSEQHSDNVSGGYSGPVYSSGDHTLRWNAHTLSPHEEGWVKYRVEVKKPKSACTEVVPNTAKITAKELNNFQTWVESNSVDLTISKISCEPPKPVTIKATKIVCENEADLPNWGAGGPDITATTASDFLASHPTCHLEDGWIFEWANAGTANPGDNTGAGGAGWTPFPATDASGVATVSIDNWTGDRIWVREQWSNDYIPFKGTVVDANSAELYCSKDVLNYDNYDFVQNPERGATYHCVAWNVPKPPPPGTPECTLVADPTTIDAGGSSTLTWTTKNATTATINRGIGDVSPVSGGTVSVSPSEDTTYTLTATGPGGTVTCNTEVNVRVIPPTPVCSLTADKGSIEDPDDEVTLSWTSSNADTLVFNQGIGDTTPVNGGTLVVSPDDTTTYTGTWTGSGGSVDCSVTINVDESDLACELTIAPNSIKKGESATLSWSSSNVETVSIDNGIGERDPSGSETITPSDTGSYLYKGTFTSEDGEIVHCSSALTVEGGGGGGGGGSRRVRVTFDSFEPEGEVLASYVYLSEVPYTGLDLGPLGTVFYWLMLALWSAAAAYLVLFNLVPFMNRKARGFGEGIGSILNSSRGPAPAPAYATPLPTYKEPETELPGYYQTGYHAEDLPDQPHGYSTYKGFRSFANGNALTVDDVVRGLARLDTAPRATYEAPKEQLFMRSDVPPVEAYDNERPHPAYDAWKSASLGNNVEPIYTSVEPMYQNVEPITPSIPRPAYQNIPETRPTDMHGIMDADVHGFLDALIAADREATFGFLRQMTRSGIAVEKFLTRALHALDDAFRARVEGAEAHPEVVRITSATATPTLENVVAALAQAVDSSYTKGMTGAKLALTRALDAVEN